MSDMGGWICSSCQFLTIEQGKHGKSGIWGMENENNKMMNKKFEKKIVKQIKKDKIKK